MTTDYYRAIFADGHIETRASKSGRAYTHAWRVVADDKSFDRNTRVVSDLGTRSQHLTGFSSSEALARAAARSGCAAYSNSNPVGEVVVAEHALTKFSTFPDVDADTLTALREYAGRWGKGWKTQLEIEWYRASAPGLLHALRNHPSFGPGTGWLAQFKFPKVS